MAVEQDFENIIEADTVTLKDLIVKTQEYIIELLKHWKLILIISFPFALIFMLRVIMTPITYTAELTFMVNEDEGGGIGGAMAILSQFGFGSGGSGKFNLDKVLGLSKTRRIIQPAIFSKIEVDGNRDYIGNHIIDLYDLHEDWEDSKSGLKDFKFTHDSIDRFSRVENAAFKTIYSRIVGSEYDEGLYSSRIDEKTGIMAMQITSDEEVLSIELLDLIYAELSDYYINKTVEKQRVTFEVVKAKVDSIEQALTNAEYRLAKFRDRNRGLWTKEAGLEEDRLSRKLQMLTIMYGEALKNQEIADFTLKNKTPFVQIIDRPLSPISPNVESKFRALVLGGILGGFLAVFFIIGRKIIRDTLKG